MGLWADQTSRRIWFVMPPPSNRPRRRLIDLHPASNTFQALFTLTCGILGAFVLHRTDWTKHLWLIGELIAPHAWALGLIAGLLLGLLFSGLVLLLVRSQRR
ncbi:MAG: hypothetical protein IBJ18_11825 [Phycisphaerales bacterium]|nr:hypothetical protein [Phycisphaerales bacterium]